MVVWSGYGILSAFLLVFCLGLGFAAGSGTGIPEGYAAGGGLLIGAVLNWFMGRRFNNPANDRELVDPRTGGRVMLKRRHSLFYVPMQYWSLPAVLFGMVLIVQQATGHYTPGRSRTKAPAAAMLIVPGRSDGDVYHDQPRRPAFAGRHQPRPGGLVRRMDEVGVARFGIVEIDREAVGKAARQALGTDVRAAGESAHAGKIGAQRIEIGEYGGDLGGIGAQAG